DRPDQVAFRYFLAAGLPGGYVFGVPVLDVAITGQYCHAALPAVVQIGLLPSRSASIAPPYRNCQHALTSPIRVSVRNGIHDRRIGETAPKQLRPGFREGERRQYSAFPAGSVRVRRQQAGQAVAEAVPHRLFVNPFTGGVTLEAWT